MERKRPGQGLGPGESHAKRPRSYDICCRGCRRTCHDECAAPLNHEDYTIAWICALPLELEASRAMLDEEHGPLFHQSGDVNAYVLGRACEHNVVMVCLPGEYGTINAAIVAENLKRSFPNIRATLMVGVGGGVPGRADLRLGDVVVGTRVIQYDMGKLMADGEFEATGEPKIPGLLLRSAVSNLRSKHGGKASSDRMKEILQDSPAERARPSQPDRLFQSAYDHPPNAQSCDNCDLEKLQLRRERPSHTPRIHHGLIASGNSVMKNARTRDQTAQRLKALCFEMETAGMMDSLECLPIRGICDYSDSHKNKDWQDYAAAVAAAYARELIEVLEPSIQDRGVRRAVTNVQAVEPRTTDHNASKRRKRLVESLDFPRIENRKTTIRAAHGQTCSWFPQHEDYRDWLDPAKQSLNHGFLWVRGKAGAGKSTMMKFVYLRTKRGRAGPNAAIASFFFNARGDYLEKSITGMYRSLLLQLFESFPDLQLFLDDTDIVPRSQEDCPDLVVLKELIRSAVLALNRRSFTCFIDALDECDEDEVRDMVEFFEDLAQITSDKGLQFRICFSSRPYPYIQIRKGILFTLEDESGHAEDLAKYVESHLRITDPLLLGDLQTQILEKASGIFMWIVLVVEILNTESAKGGLSLKRKLSQIPAKLSDLFKSMLTRDQESMSQLRLCIVWILCAKRPLSPSEFRHALWAGLLEYDLVDRELPVNADEDTCIQYVTIASKGLAEITKSRHPTVQFIHESVRDFLVKDKGLQDLWPDLGFDWEGHAEDVLKCCCATYLDRLEVRPIVAVPYGVETWDAHPAKGCSFLDYASQHVLNHSDAAASVIPQDNFLSKFCFDDWICAINLSEGFGSPQYHFGTSPLYVLAHRGLGNLIRIQMTKEAAAYDLGTRYKHPLFAALANGHKGAVAALSSLPSFIYRGVDITQGLKYRKDLMNFEGRTPLSWAAQEGRESILKALVQGGANPDEIDDNGLTPLQRAMKTGHIAATRLLINMHVDLNAIWNNGWTALTWAAKEGTEGLVRLLIQKEADVNLSNDSGTTALIYASQYGHNAVARQLIEGGADVNILNDSGMTALIWTLRNGRQDIAQYLIERGADANVLDEEGMTALIRASQKGYEAVARLLIERRADVNMSDYEGMTALICASQEGHKAIAQLLIEEGADVNVADNFGKTALIWASQEGYEAIARLLVERRADVNIVDKEGKTALIWAFQERHEAIVRLLIE